MTDKEQADCLIELHKEQSLKHKQLVDLEFKVNISLWTFISFAGYFIVKEIFPNHRGTDAIIFSVVYWLISIFIILAHYHFWLFPITRSQAVSDYFVKNYLCKIEELAELTISSNSASSRPVIKTFCDFAPNYRGWILKEAAITLFLLSIIFLFGFFEVIQKLPAASH